MRFCWWSRTRKIVRYPEAGAVNRAPASRSTFNRDDRGPMRGVRWSCCRTTRRARSRPPRRRRHPSGSCRNPRPGGPWGGRADPDPETARDGGRGIGCAGSTRAPTTISSTCSAMTELVARLKALLTGPAGRRARQSPSRPASRVDTMGARSRSAVVSARPAGHYWQSSS